MFYFIGDGDFCKKYSVAEYEIIWFYNMVTVYETSNL